MAREIKKKNIVSTFTIAMQILANTAVVLGVFFAFLQVRDYRLRESAQLALRFGEYLDDPPYLDISEILDTAGASIKIFQPDGRFSNGELDRYLGTFETLGDLYDKGLITHEMFDNNFAYYIQRLFANNQIRQYINESRKGNPNWWVNLVHLGKVFAQIDSL